MKALILAGGLGTRLGEETGVRPKPMVHIGEYPILWHILKIYSAYGFNDFVILLGYRGSVIRQYFANYFLNHSCVTFDLKNNSMEVIRSRVEPWRVTLLETGLNTLTGGRVLRARDIVGNEPFMLTYGDGVADSDIKAVVQSHERSGKHLTMTSVQPEGRFGKLRFGPDGELLSFQEKQKGDGGWINGGFFVCQPEVFDYIRRGDQTMFEREPLETLAADRQINSYRHQGFWECMDSLADKERLAAMWESGEAKWQTW